MYATALPCVGDGLQETPQANNPALDDDANAGVFFLFNNNGVCVVFCLFVVYSIIINDNILTLFIL